MENLSELDDLSLVRQIQHGNEAAMEEFYIRFAPGLHAFIRQRVKESTDIEDVLSETMIASITAIIRFKGESKVFSWLCRIAEFKIADFYRRIRGKETLLLDESTSQIPEPPQDPEQHLLIWQVLSRLSQEYRLILEAKYFNGFTTCEIAAQTGRSEKAIESILVRARRAFSKEYRRLAPELEV